jgi:HEAT repeat protein
LIQRLAEESNLSYRRFFMACLKEIGTEAKDCAIGHLHDKRWFVVRNMVVLLRSFEDPAVVPHFRLIADHPHPKVRQEVIKTLYAFRHSEADRLLLNELRASNHEIVLTAIQIAEQSKDPRIFANLRKILTIKLLAKAEYELQSAAVKSLGKIANTTIIPDLEKMLGQKSLFAANLLKQLKVDIVRSLELYPLPAVAPLLDKIQRSGVAELAPIAAGIKKKLENRAFYEP